MGDSTLCSSIAIFSSQPLFHWKGWNAKSGCWKMDQNSASQNVFWKVAFPCSFLIALEYFLSPEHWHMLDTQAQLQSSPYRLTHFKYLESQAHLYACSKRSFRGWATQHLFRVASPLSWRMCIRATFQCEGRRRITDSADLTMCSWPFHSGAVQSSSWWVPEWR